MDIVHEIVSAPIVTVTVKAFTTGQSTLHMRVNADYSVEQRAKAILQCAGALRQWLDVNMAGLDREMPREEV